MVRPYVPPPPAALACISALTCCRPPVFSFGVMLWSLWCRDDPYKTVNMPPLAFVAAVARGLRPEIPSNCPLVRAACALPRSLRRPPDLPRPPRRLCAW